MEPGRGPGHTGNRRAAPTRYGPEIMGRCRAGLVRGRAATAAAARHSPILSRDRRKAVPLRKHHQVAGGIDLPQARGFLTQRGDPTRQETRLPRLMTSGRRSSLIEATCRPALRQQQVRKAFWDKITAEA